MTPRDDLDRAYQQLTDMQKAVVDARVANPDVPKTHISRDHAPKIYNEEYADSEADHKDEFNNSHVTQMLNGNTNELIPEIIEYRQDIAHNQRSEGTMTTEGDPFTADPNMDDSEGWQTWDERPNKAAAQSDNPTDSDQADLVQSAVTTQPRIQVGDTGDGVVLKIDYSYLQELLEAQTLPPELNKELTSLVFQKAQS